MQPASDGTGIIAGGAIEGAVVAMSSAGKVYVNSPSALAALIPLMSYFGLLVIAAMMGQSVYQDFHHKTYALFFTKPIKKFDYLFGRFSAAFIILILIFSSVGIGMLIGSYMPFLERSVFGPTNIMAYILPYLTSVIPNIFFIGAIFFCMASLTKKMIPVYVSSVVLLVGWLIALNLSADLESKSIASLIDPFGMSALRQVTEYWTIAEQNTKLVHLTGMFLLNRILWVGIGFILLVITYLKFSFSHITIGKKSIKKEIKEDKNLSAIHTMPKRSIVSIFASP